jgi:hypothetical protein
MYGKPGDVIEIPGTVDGGATDFFTFRVNGDGPDITLEAGGVLYGKEDILVSLGPGQIIGPASGFYGPDDKGDIDTSEFPSIGAYFAFEAQTAAPFTGKGGANLQTDYGYGLLETSPDGSTITLVAFAYDNSGAPIVTPPLPEPQAWSLMSLGAALVGAAMRTARRMRKAPA